MISTIKRKLFCYKKKIIRYPINEKSQININALRINYFDILRIISSFAVIIIHVSARYNSLNCNNYNYKIGFFYNGVSRFGVPIFFMISGALFLNKDISFEKIFKKYIRKIIIHLISWSFIYSFYSIKYSNFNFNKIIINFFSGHFHFWYLYITIQLYIIVPFLREIVKKQSLFKAFIILSFVFTFLFSYLNKIKSFCHKLLSKILNVIYLNLKNKYLRGHIFYFILGYYLNNSMNIDIYKKILFYSLGLIGFFFIIIFYYLSIKYHQSMIPFYFRPLNLNILAYSIGIFVFFKHNFNNISIKYMKFIKIISSHTFGIYLIHPMIINIIRGRNDSFLSSLNLIYKIPLMSLITFLFSFMISIIIKYLPFIGNWLV